MPTRKGGMPKGHKTKKTLIKEEVERKSTELTIQFFNDTFAEKGQKVITAIFDQAINDGCRTSQKMIMDRFAPVAKAIDANANKQDFNIHINVGELSRPNIIEVKGEDNEDENGQTDECKV